MASIKPRKRGNDLGLQALDGEMQRAFSMKMGKIKRQNQDVHEEDPDSGVIYVSHLPHGFYEPQMKKFFSQFGNIKRLRLSRSKKSGQSKGYAYIEFEFNEVAKVVAETMHNYLMYQKLLKCFYVPKEKLHPETFKGCFRHFKKPKRREVSARRNNSLLESGKDHILESQKRRVSTLKKKQQKLNKLGIDFKIENVDDEWERLKESQPSEPAPKAVAAPRGSKGTKATKGGRGKSGVSPKGRARTVAKAGKGKKKGPAKREGRDKGAKKPAAKSNKSKTDQEVESQRKVDKKAPKTVTPVKRKAAQMSKSAKVGSKTKSVTSTTSGRKKKRLSV